MFVTVVAVMCKLMVAHATITPSSECTAEEAKIEEIVTDSSMDERVDFHGCMIHHQIGIAEWKGKHPIYAKDGWRVARVKCAPGRYEPKNAV
ncbi:hypothetical protein [Bradyrhizobium phage BDU-MI-1]|nr:hypothetical protein [Bradyrhizobium phage BDU-MI-1]